MALLHGLEQRRLRLRRCPIDFIRQQQVRENRPAEEPELTRPPSGILLDDIRARDVRRHQVRRELDAMERERQEPSESAREERFREPRHADEDRMAVREEGNRQELDHAVLADDHFSISPVRRRYAAWSSSTRRASSGADDKFCPADSKAPRVSPDPSAAPDGAPSSR
jgi:hypothetical protein